MNNTLTRFYAVSELFRDDERIMAIAIKEHTLTADTKCGIYKDLLNCRYVKWIDDLESITHLICDEWIECRLFMMNNGHDKMFLKGDLNMIEYMCIEEEDN